MADSEKGHDDEAQVPSNSSGSSKTSGAPWKLTVDKLSKIEREMAVREKLRSSANRSDSTFLSVTILLFVAVLLFLVCLVCMTATKVSFVYLANQFMIFKNKTIHDKISVTTSGYRIKREISDSSAVESPQKKAADDGDSVGVETVGVESVFCMILIVLNIPYGLTFLRSLWCGGIRTDRPWPAWSAIAWGVFASLLEASGVSLFILEVLSKTSLTDVEKVSMFSAVFLVAMILYLITGCCGDNYDRPSRPKLHTGLLIVGLIFLLAALSIICYDDILVNRRNTGGFGSFWMIPLSLTLLAVAWCPESQRFQIVPNSNQLQRLLYKKRAPAFMNENPPMSSLESVDTSIPYRDMEFSARWKSSIINSFLKIVFTITFCIVYCHLTGIINVHDLNAGMRHIKPSHPSFIPFMLNIFCGFGGYMLGWIACTVCLQQQCFALPLMFVAPASIAVTALIDNCVFPVSTCMDMSREYKDHPYFIAASSACFVAAQICAVLCFVWRAATIRMQKESQLFWLPSYSTAFLDPLMILTRISNRYDPNICPITGRVIGGPSTCRGKQTRTVICTTMYREAPHEMTQLLQSLADINKACQQDSGRDFQAHVIFDNGVRDKRLTHFALQLVFLCKKNLGVKVEDCKKISTPYGMQLVWELPVVNAISGGADIENQNRGMLFKIHLKDNQKVKNKKRWSQVMYMSYVLDYLSREDAGTGEGAKEAFILTTDADVKFTHDSVETLLDLMHRNTNVGAVCARTHPMGSGPVYWYQIFDYAIGHWLQKTAEHVLGSVLCSPGCFSVYRAEAIRDVLKTYSSKVEMASEFLTKDMGEDRYLATLLVQSGWRLEYCAAAGIETFCPDEFDEFFKQRRRWLPSTLANQVLLLKEWRQTVSHLNKQISPLFLLYQGLLLFATLINPAVSILVIVGGLYYSWSVSQLLSTVVLVLITVFYAIICIYGTPEIQLKMAKILTFLFALVMGAVFVGTIAQIVEENSENHAGLTTLTPTVRPPTTTSHKSQALYMQEREVDILGQLIQNLARSERQLQAAAGFELTTPAPIPMEIKLPVSVSTIYIAVLTGIFLVTALMHPTEMYCLLHGVWYLLCLPAGNILLLIYSICNLTDGSWGTREEKQDTAVLNGDSWLDRTWESIKRVLPCCKDEREKERKLVPASDEDVKEPKTAAKLEPEHRAVKSLRPTVQRTDSGRRFKTHEENWIPLENWLPENLRALYASKFLEKGFDDTSFVVGLTDKELKDYIGIASKPHRYAILEAVRLLPDLDIEPCVPNNVDHWLESIGLEMYSGNFRKFQIVTSNNLEILKAMSREDIQKELEITKAGHQKRLLLAIEKLRYPNRTENEIWTVKREIEQKKPESLEESNESEYHFWESLRSRRLKPSSLVFANAINLKEKLHELRNSALVMLAIANSMWLLLISTLIKRTELNLLQTNVLGLMFLIVFGLILSIQFLCMIIHRVTTWMHKIARAPRRCGQAPQADFAFTDTNDLGDSSQFLNSNQFEQSVDVRADRRNRARTARSRSGANSLASFMPRGLSGLQRSERRPLMTTPTTTYSETDIH